MPGPGKFVQTGKFVQKGETDIYVQVNRLPEKRNQKAVFMKKLREKGVRSPGPF
jgi:hypothetical protein